MAFLGFNSRRYEMLMSAILLVYAQQLRCVGNFNRYVPLVNDIPARRGNACVRICTPLQASIQETDANSELQHYTAQLQDRAPLQAQSAIQFWLDRESSYKRLSHLALDLMVSHASQAYVERLF